MAREVLHIFVLGVDDFSQFASIHRLLKHPHFHSLVKFGILGCVVAHYFGNGRTPAEPEVRGQQRLWVKYEESLTFFDMRASFVNVNAIRWGIERSYLCRYLVTAVSVQRSSVVCLLICRFSPNLQL